MKYWTDFVNEVDWAVGYILDYLKKHAPNTLVVLSSDNGPYKESASSYCPQNCMFATPQDQKDKVPRLFGCSPCEESIVSQTIETNTGGKGNTWEGGQHVPAIAWWPGKITPGTINPHVSSGLDLLPTFLKVAGGELPENVEFDGKDISDQLCNPNVEASETPKGHFIYWCGLFINAVRIGQYKVIYRTQKFVGATQDAITPPNLCAQKGDCCPNSPGRLCSCDWVKDYEDNPIVIDLINNPTEDVLKALDDKNDIIAEAAELKLETLRSVLDDRKVPHYLWDRDSDTDMQQVLGELPNFPNVDLCFETTMLEAGPFLSGPIDGDENLWKSSPAVYPNGCAFVPEAYQKSFLPGMDFSFYKYQNCSVSACMHPDYSACLGFSSCFIYNIISPC